MRNREKEMLELQIQHYCTLLPCSVLNLTFQNAYLSWLCCQWFMAGVLNMRPTTGPQPIGHWATWVTGWWALALLWASRVLVTPLARAMGVHVRTCACIRVYPSPKTIPSFPPPLVPGHQPWMVGEFWFMGNIVQRFGSLIDEWKLFRIIWTLLMY